MLTIVTAFDDVWMLIEAHAGEEFHTTTGLPFSYRIQASAVVPDRTNYPIHRNQFRKAFDLMPLPGPGAISDIVRGSAYVHAVLSDRRSRP